jgi:hypothetical protein
MLGQVELPMNRSHQFASFMPRTGAARGWMVAVLLCAGSAGLLQAQNLAQTSAQDEKQTAPAVLPVAPLPAAPSLAAGASGPSTSSMAPAPRFDPAGLEPAGSDPDAAAATLHRNWNPPPALALYWNAELEAPGWNRSSLDPLQPGLGFGTFSAPAGAGIEINTVRRFSAGAQGLGGFDLTRSPAFSGRASIDAPLFRPTMAPTSNNLFIPASGGLPSLDQVLRGSYSLPFGAPSSGLRFSYPGAIFAAGSAGDSPRPSGSMTFTSSDLGNGMFFSAGTGYSHSTAGAPAAGLGSNASAGAKHSGPSVALKLSF